MTNPSTASADPTAVRVALWRALHLEADAPPHVFEDEVGLRLASPEEGWRNRPDMNRAYIRPFIASIVARARFVEDLVAEEVARGIPQYVILGAGLDTFAQRKPELASRLQIYEIDKPGAQAWKRQRLVDLGYGVPDWLRFVPVDFESGASWWESLTAAGFNAREPAVVASTGVSMYLTQDAIEATLRQVAALPTGSSFAMTFLLPIEMADPEMRPGLEMAVKGARASGTPFINFFTPDAMMNLARKAGSVMCGTTPRRVSGSVTSRAAPTDFARRRTPRRFSSRRCVSGRFVIASQGGEFTHTLDVCASDRPESRASSS
jgi:methyltransferase (TIGR00027 family)